MKSNLMFVHELPSVNYGDNFLILESAKEELAVDWFEYIKLMIKLSLQNGSEPKFKSISDSLKENGAFYSMNSYTQNILGIGSEFAVIDMVIDSGMITHKALIDYYQLVDIYFGEENIKLNNKFAKRAIVDRFFAFMWSQKKLLYPIIKKPQGYQRSGDWKELIKETQISIMLEERFSSKVNNQAKNYQKTAIYATLVATSWHTVEAIKEDDFRLLENAIQNSSELIFKQKKYYKLVLNELRYAIINSGRDDITTPRDIAKIIVDDTYLKQRTLNWIDLELYPKMEKIVFMAMEFPSVLKRDGLASGTIVSSMSAISNFMKYIITYYPNSEINITTIDYIFEPENEYNIYNVLKENKQTTTVQSEMGTIIKFLVYCELYSAKAKKNTPRASRKKSSLPYRSAMPQEMIRHIVDIIKNRPPNSTTPWAKKEEDNTWWKHDVYPVYPMMMLFGYYIPLRGSQVRHLCRQNSFVFSDDGKIETIIINTDKNVNRKHLQEIPCVWDDLQIFVPFLKWHKRYYQHIPKILYHDDENTPWEQIEPLFITPNVLKPLSRSTHFDYHKKVLCQYQLEVMQEALKNGSSSYPKVAWSKKGKPFFKDVDELNKCSSARMSDIDVMYDLHSLRVTGATRYLESGVGLNLVMQLTGHMTPDTLTRIYINLTMKEKKEKLKSAIGKIYFGNADKLIESTSDLLKGELTQAYEKSKGEIETTLADNALFSFARKPFFGATEREFEKGTEIALHHHPSTWFPMVHGICPAVKCPEGREDRCSLCPYLITGKLFINGITLKANQALAKFQRDSLQKQEDESKGYKNQALTEGLEVLLEEILAWWEIIKKIEVDLSDETTRDESHKVMVARPNEKKSIFATEAIKTELAYLKNAYDAKIIGVEQDRVGLKILTIKAMKLAFSMKDNKGFALVSDNEEDSIDYLMNYYNEIAIDNNSMKNFISNLEHPIKRIVI